MNDELEAIKQRAAERRKEHGYYIDPDGDFAREELAQAEADLDRAIEIAEHWYKNARVASDKWSVASGERDQARADVLKLRDVLSNLYAQEHEFFPPGTWDEAQERTVSALADTESYEQYR